MTDILTLEQRLFRAWPALETEHYHGWLLRFAGGYTRRANSVNPIAYFGDEDNLNDHIDHCEAEYRKRDLPVVFRMTDITQPPVLEDLLALRGYEQKAATLVQAADLAPFSGSIPPNAIIDPALTDAWLNHFLRLNPALEENAVIMRQMMARIEPECAFIRLLQGNEVVAVGLGVRDEGYMGLFDVVTNPDHRRQGHGRALVESLLAWGVDGGAHTAYLQVVQENTPAQRLYARLGFQTTYEYWYRVKV